MDWSDGGWSTDVLFFFWGNGVYPKCRVLRKLSAASAERGLEQGSPLFQPWETHMLRIVDRSLHMLLSVSFLLWFIITMILYDHCSSASSSSSHYDDCDTLQTLHVFFVSIFAIKNNTMDQLVTFCPGPKFLVPWRALSFCCAAVGEFSGKMARFWIVLLGKMEGFR